MPVEIIGAPVVIGVFKMEAVFSLKPGQNTFRFGDDFLAYTVAGDHRNRMRLHGTNTLSCDILVEMGVLAGVSVEADGTLVERSRPNYLHGKTQALLIALFMALRKTSWLYPCASTRMMLRSGRFLIPDVAVFHRVEPGLVPDTPPLIAVEILSPRDRLAEVREKLEEYRTWGVRHIWLVDPHSRRLYSCGEGLREVSFFQVGELDIEVTPEQIFE